MKLCLLPTVALLTLSNACSSPASEAPVGQAKPAACVAVQAAVAAPPVAVVAAAAATPKSVSATNAVNPVTTVATTTAGNVAAATSGNVAAATSGTVAAATGGTVTAGTRSATSTPAHVGESAVKVKRFVVAMGVKDREPLVGGDALPADGSAIYAFAELANPLGESENVRVTFERKGGSERVGEVTLPVPANTQRHRTWAFTRFIRAAGVWEAVLWSENGTELGRTSFEVKGS